MLFSVVAASLATTSWTPPAQAQTAPAPDLVNVCTGIRLPRSAVTNIMEPVINGVVGPVQGTVNSLLGIVDLLTLKVLPSSLNIDTAKLLSDAANGDPVSLQAVTVDGKLLGSSDLCNLQSDSYSLAKAEGISIGGNSITGLGSNTRAVSGEINSIAFGNGAVTASSALGAVALGTGALVENGAIGGLALGQGARVLAQGGVALGAGALVTRGPLAGYSAYGLSGTYTSAGSVSLGSGGAERQIINLAPGSDPTDAVNVAQLDAVSSRVGALGSLALQYDDLRYGTVTLGGASATRIANLAPGSVSANSSEAVNGSQLYETNSLVAGNTSAITGLGGQIADHDTRLAAQASDLAANGLAIQANDTAITNLGSDIANGTVGPVRYADALTPTVPNGGTPSQSLTLVGAGTGSVGLHNLANGRIASGSTDAINGDQLFQTNDAIAGNTASIGTLRTDLDGQGTILDGAVATLTDQGTKLTQYGSAIDRIDVRLSGYDNTLDTQDNLLRDHTGQLSAIATDIAAANAGILAADQAIGNLGSDIANGTVGPVRYADALTPTVPNGGTPSQSLTLVGAGTGSVGLHNLANGRIASGSTDAINGDQLFQTNDAIAGNTASIGTLRTDLDGQGTILDGAVATLTDQGTKLTQYGSAIDRIDVRLTGYDNTLDTQDNLLRDHTGQLSAIATDIASANAGILAADQAIGNLRLDVDLGLVGPVRYADSFNPLAPNAGIVTDNLLLAGASGGPVFLRNLAPGLIGSGSLEAVNGGQLFGFGSQTAAILGLGAYDPAFGFSGSFVFRGAPYSNVQDVIGAIEGNLVNMGSWTGGAVTALKYFNTNSVLSDSSATGQDSVATGPSALASGDAAVASGRNAKAESYGSVAIGNEAVASGGMSVSIGTANVASGDGAVAIGDPNYATGLGAIALGRDNIATGDGAVALGDTNQIEGNGALALGLRNVGNGAGATLLGSLNVGTGQGAVAIGVSNQVSGIGSIAVGDRNVVTGAGSIAIGNNTSSSQSDALAIGSYASVGAVHAAAIGNRAVASQEKAIAVGNDAMATAVRSSAFGTAAIASGLDGTAIGASSAATAPYSTAVGRDASAAGFGGASFGLLSASNGYATTALGSGAIADHDGSVALGTATRTVRGEVGSYAAFGLNSVQSSSGEIAIARNISYFDPIAKRYTSTGDRQITGVAAGSADTDAVNVAQLKGIAGTLGTALAGGFGGGASYDTQSGTISGPTYSVNGTSYANVSDAFGALASQIGAGQAGAGQPAAGQTGSNQPDPQLLAQVQALSAQLAALQAQIAGLQAAAAGLDAGAPGGTTQTARLSNVADGRVAAGSTDAINGSQLAAVQREVASAVQYETAANGAPTNRVVLASSADGSGTAVTNVAPGALSAGSHDAVNGSQLYETNQAVAAVRSTADEALALGQNSIRYDDASREVVTLAQGSAPVRLRNLAPGVESTDAASVGQLNAGLGRVLSEAGAYTDLQVAALGFDLKQASRRAASGTSGALAVAGMPQPYEPGRSMVALGVGTYNGEQAISIGFSGTGSDGDLVAKAGIAYDSMGKVSASAGMGLQF